MILNSNNYNKFINQMEVLGYKSKEGKYLAFLNEKSNKYIRTKTLGINYTKNSVKYRIDNKDLNIEKFKYMVQTERIDTTQDKFKKNYGLKKWGTKQNLRHLQEISHLVFNENMSSEEIENIRKTEEEFIKDIETNLEKRDNLLHDLDKKANAFDDYKDSTNLIADYKKSNNKREFKSRNYHAFRNFDNAKRDMILLKKEYNISNYKDLVSYQDNIIRERNLLYKEYNNIQKDRMKEEESERKSIKNIIR